jgi:[calcium/calmodulin-dependent protein kinase] kinase
VSGRKIINQYEIIDELGRGVHGKVKLGRNLETGDNVAIKIVDRFSKRRRLGKNTSHEDKIKREIAILKKARHPNIVSLLEVIDDPKRKKVYIVLEHVELGEVRWRTLGEREITLIEWRRHQRESQGIFDNESAALEDERIITLAHQRLERQQRRRQRLLHNRRRASLGNEPWSLELGGESDDDASEGRQSRASIYGDDRISRPVRLSERRDENSQVESNMETAVRVPTPTSTARQTDFNAETGLEGTMYGAYETEMLRGRTPSVAESSSSHFTDEDEVIPEPFTYVPLLTLQAARETFRDTVLGLEYLHFQNVVHRDIKPANLLQTKEHRIKISDFGVSYLGRNPQPEEANGDLSESDYPDVDEAIELAKTVGTPAFYAPELCQTDLAAEPLPVDKQIDVWALGVTLYCLIYGRVPFHADGPFGMMRAIAEEDVYIPTKRLKAVAEQSGSRPNSHGRPYQSMTSSKRAPHDLEYEEVGDYLRDLLNRLLTKDPRRRITIKEIKRHPWLFEGIENFPSWVEETDPSRSSQGRKIEVSNEDVEKAVVPITLIDRVRSGVRKTLESVFTMGRRGGSRRRAQSTVMDPPQSISAHSSSSTISQEGRRPSLAINQSIFEALSRSREPEHPLSQSVTASPEATERARYFDGPDPRTASPAQSVEGNEHIAPLASSTRPVIPERAHSTMSSAASIRTVRPSDLSRSGGSASPSIPPALPGTPTALDTPGGHNLGGIFGGVPRRIVNSVRSREQMLRPPQERTRPQSIDRLGGDDDAHSGPSIALSTTSVEGHVQDVLSDLSPTLARGSSPSLSELQSPDPTERASSRQSSISSTSSYRNRTYATHSQIEASSTLEPSTYLRQRVPSEEAFNRAKDELVRRRVFEETQGRDRTLSMNAQRPASALSQSECPPSPDDEDFFRRQRRSDYFERGQHVHPDAHLVGYPSQTTALTSSSSEDQFASMSQSTSNRSIPSVASANSSVAPDECFDQHTPSAAPSAESMNQFVSPMDDPAGYDGDGDHVLESDDDESDEEDFIIMGKKKKPSMPPRSGSISNAELARSNIRKEYLSERRRSARSGSNGTVKKVEPPGGSDPEGQH